MNDDYQPGTSLRYLQARHDLVKRVRSFFDEWNFLEVCTPVLSADSVVDEHLDPLRVTCYTDPTNWEVGPVRYLQTSPEFHMKRLLAAGATAIYQISHVFRAGEIGPIHNPEFSMAEWYRVGDDMQAGMRLLCDLIESVAECGTIEKISYRAAFESIVGLDPHTADETALRSAIRHDDRHESSTTLAQLTRDDCIHRLWSFRVTPEIDTSRPLLVFDFPATQAALAQIRDDTPPVAERFELYWQGVELANGYHELLCADELARRNGEIGRKRAAAGKMQLPIESRLLDAMRSGLPACAGVALGIDRLLMLLCGEKTLQNVLPFDFSRA